MSTLSTPNLGIHINEILTDGNFLNTSFDTLASYNSSIPSTPSLSKHASEILNQEQLGLLSLSMTGDGGDQSVASPVYSCKSKNAGVTNGGAQLDLLPTIASLSPASVDKMPKCGKGSDIDDDDDDDGSRVTIRIEWIGTSPFFIGQNLKMQKEVINPNYLNPLH